MAKMMNPELEVVRFENEDVIATSYGSTVRRDASGNWWVGDRNFGTNYSDAQNAIGENTTIQYPNGEGFGSVEDVNGSMGSTNTETTWIYDGTYYVPKQ